MQKRGVLERDTAKLYLLELDRTAKQFNPRDSGRFELKENSIQYEAITAKSAARF